MRAPQKDKDHPKVVLADTVSLGASSLAKPAFMVAKSRKYRNVRVTVGAETFDSKAEARRWQELCLLEKAGRITALIRQPAFELAPSVRFDGAKRATPALRYCADFLYYEGERQVIEDVKGMQTAVFKVKRHLMLSVHGIEIRLTK